MDMTDRPSKPPTKLSIPVTLAITFGGMLVSGATAAAVVRSDVGYLGARVEHVETKVEELSDDIDDVEVAQATRTEWQTSVERRLTLLETALDKNTEALQELRDAVNRRRR